jgi:hypothetical protein
LLSNYKELFLKKGKILKWKARERKESNKKRLSRNPTFSEISIPDEEIRNERKPLTPYPFKSIFMEIVYKLLFYV